ncbi:MULTISPECIES: sodium-dependent transporter [Ectothiorhodospira]|uniref:sodium-dependent transporter n=1 Tax=Ectothiorhodospira TaxID=1051 RepID=UPI00047E23EE|nr:MULTISPECIES: sodium-dependent transporter [Ectothiorhodospira]MCG5493215.1 sodium-dependent transporter [Ectothiorhodospira variabilis]MCG5497063.1 sodium-dependent transporter [Ectothiorhodospira variabilis]MCG5502544.1 sodium-dependent transporter [Ectothiorhodospira variabilis]MCG5505690.1 sodium-dependent transporter [Ectothiorhodospira variabilis]MCG5525415.1 sodium-dependent transporter [Ectothiorhodospira haloalkaliphila]
MRRETSIHGQWSSKLIFVLAATGSAVGLGNIWRFPYIAGENGGGAFVLIYLACILAIGLPIMMAEISLGRRGRQSPINTMATLSREEGLSRIWGMVGWIGVAAGFMILSFYSVVAGWSLSYVFRAAGGAFSGLDAQGVEALFNGLVSDPERLLAWHTLFMIMNVLVVARGVRSGLEQAVKFLMPALFVLLLVMVGYAYSLGHFGEGLRFLFKPDFSQVTGDTILLAMGQSFFTLSLGMGAIMIYGSYLSSRASIARTSAAVVSADTAVALLAGMAIFPIVFASGLAADAGPGLIFMTLPLAFAEMPFGLFFGTLFFVLLVMAAWTSSISLMEPAVAWLSENRDIERPMAAVIVGAIAWLLGIGTVLSFNLWSAGFGFHVSWGGEVIYVGGTIFDILEYLTMNILLPLGGLLIALFVGWRMTRRSVEDELGIGSRLIFGAWYYVLRFAAPIGILLVFLKAINII